PRRPAPHPRRAHGLARRDRGGRGLRELRRHHARPHGHPDLAPLLHRADGRPRGRPRERAHLGGGHARRAGGRARPLRPALRDAGLELSLRSTGGRRLRAEAVIALPPMTPPASGRGRRSLYAVGACAIWGPTPVSFRAPAPVPPLELRSHRVLWAFVLLLPIGFYDDRLAELRRAARSPDTRRLLAASTLLIAANWLIYIWAVFGGHIVEASLGSFLTPLVNVLPGVLVLEESLGRPVKAALAVALIGVLWLGLLSGRPPWIAVGLALSFGSYGLVRKLVRNVGAVAGLTIETALLCPVALGYLASAHARGTLAFLAGPPLRDVLLLLSGPVTAVPLLLFAGAVARLPLSSMGLLQYVSPSVQFLLAVLVYHEPFRAGQAGAFGLIWLALALFAAHTIRRDAAEPVMEP